MDNGTSQLTHDELRKIYGDLLLEIGTLESATGSTYKVAAGWLNSQDFLEVDTHAGNLEQFLNSAINFVNEVHRDVADLRNLLTTPRDHGDRLESIGRELDQLAESHGTPLKTLCGQAGAEARRELIFRQDLADATIRFLDAVKGYADRAATKASGLLEGWDRVEVQANFRAAYDALQVTHDAITSLVARGSAPYSVVSTDANPALTSTRQRLQAQGWRHGQNNDLLTHALQQDRLVKHFPAEARRGLTFEAGLQHIDKTVSETFGEGGSLDRLSRRIRARMDWLDDLGIQFPVRIDELASD
jgi:hypothetical protein